MVRVRVFPSIPAPLSGAIRWSDDIRTRVPMNIVLVKTPFAKTVPNRHLSL